MAEAYLWRGEAAYRAKEYQEAIDSTEGYLKHRPESLPLNPNAYYSWGMLILIWVTMVGGLERYLSSMSR